MKLTMGENDALKNSKEYFEVLYNVDKDEDVPVNICGLEDARRGSCCKTEGDCIG